jgi:ethylmalonyl-CoA/methylmalonyl-CoA decarboxylase
VIDFPAIDFRAWVATLPPSEGTIRVATDGDVTEIVIDHPRTKNALSPRMMVELADAVEAARTARVVILRGEGGAFCSGGNLDAVRRHLVAPGMGRALATFMHAASDALLRLDAIVIGILEGAALGGGAELLTACDVVVAAPDARYGFVQARLGVSPGFGGGTRLVRIVGPRVALRLLTEARALTADEALRLGLVDEIAADPPAVARSRARDLCRLDPAALRVAKRIVTAASTLPHAEALAAELDLFTTVWGADAHLRALPDRAPSDRALPDRG